MMVLGNPCGRDTDKEMDKCRMKQRTVLADIKEFLSDYDPEQYEDGSGDVQEIFKIVRDMVKEADPTEVLRKRLFTKG